METIEYRLPSWTLGSLFCSDDSGLDDSDIEKLNQFVAENVNRYGSFHAVDYREEGFCHSNDLDRYASDCCTVIFDIKGE